MDREGLKGGSGVGRMPEIHSFTPTPTMTPIRPCSNGLLCISSIPILLASILVAPSVCVATTFPWQEPHAHVIPTGDLQWSPTPFVFEAGPSVYYIDYEGGSDQNDGRSPVTPFKHHPWDSNATGAVRNITGIHTYVFKRGVFYRGELVARESGVAGNPIRLTSDPSWGSGDAIITGSQRVTSAWTRCGPEDAPGINHYQDVWFTDLPFTIQDNSYGGTAGQVFVSMLNEWRDGDWHRIQLARAPNWEVEDPNYPQRDWWTVESSGTLRIQQTFPQTQASQWIGGTVWSNWGTGSGADANMSTYQQGKITSYNNGVITIDIRSDPGCKYFVENLPQLLDAPNEFYYSPSGTFSRRLYLRLPGDRDPNSAMIEVAARIRIIRIVDRSHITISGLTLAGNNQPRPGVVPNPPHWNTNDGNNQAIELSGNCSHITISHCKFRQTIMAIAPRRDDGVAANLFDNITISDNDIAWNEDQAITLTTKNTTGYVRNSRILRNRLSQIGYRQTCRSYSSIPAIQVSNATSVQIAGNFVDHCWGIGINLASVTGNTAQAGSQVRNLVHHNKVVTSLLGTNDWGGIEGWNHGPAFFFNNISGNPRGYRPFSGNNSYNPWGHAIYFDHASHHYGFNNIVWGQENALNNPLARNNAGFMQAAGGHSFFANNTIYRFYRGFCFSRPGSKYVGNLLQGISYRFHDETQSTLSWIAYARNVYQGNPTDFNPNQRTLTQFQNFLRNGNAHSSQVGLHASQPVLIDPANGDFRPTGEALGNGARIFIPWNLAHVRGEWHFFSHPADYTTIASNDSPSGGTGNTLRCLGATADSFVMGTLEDWIEGALRFDGVSTSATASTSAPFDMTTDGFIIEAVLRATEPDRAIVSKGTASSGYRLDITPAGHLRVSLSATQTFSQESATTVADGEWHHVLAEVDRANSRVNLFINGALSLGSASGAPLASSASLSNSGDFRVGRDHTGRFFAGEIDFLRVARTTFADSQTSFEELYTWQFDGPAQRDFSGRKVHGTRHAGAIHFTSAAGVEPFQVQLLSPVDGRISIAWTALTGVEYALLRSEDLVIWTEVDRFVGTGAEITFSEEVTDRAFYLVRATTD